MESEKLSEKFVRNLLLILPSWHSKLVRPFKELLKKEMSLETYYCLETLKQYGTVTMTELAHQMRVPKQQLTKLIDKLMECQFVERVPKEEDKRAVLIRLTVKATEYLENYYRKNTDFIRVLEEQLSEEELQKLNTAAEILTEILPKLSPKE